MEIDIHAHDEAAKRAERKCTDPREYAKFKPSQRVTVQDPISKKWSTTAIVLEEREHGNSYVLTTEGTDKTFIRGQQLLKPHSVPIHSQVNPVQKELPTPYTPPVTRLKTKSYLEAAKTTMPKSARNSKSNKGKEVCRRATTDDQVPHTGEGRRGHNLPQGEQLRSVQPLGRRRDIQRFEHHPVRHDWYSDPRHVLTVQVVESKPDDEADCQGRQGKALVHTKNVQPRGVSNPNPSTHSGVNRGKATSVPVHNPQSWRNPGGPIGSPASHKTTSYVVAKPNNAGKHKRHAGRNVRRQHPYAGHKHAQKDSTNGCQPPKKETGHLEKCVDANLGRVLTSNRDINEDTRIWTAAAGCTINCIHALDKLFLKSQPLADRRRAIFHCKQTIGQKTSQLRGMRLLLGP